MVVAKEKHPNWYPTASILKEHAANGDPLPEGRSAGDPVNCSVITKCDSRWGWHLRDPRYQLIPLAVGMAITHGCVRMYPEDVAALFPKVPVGTKVWLINDPVKVTYVGGDLLVEAHPPVDAEGQTVEPNLELLSKQLDHALGKSTAAIHWDFAREALQAATGMPTIVGLEVDFDPTSAPSASATGSGASSKAVAP